MSRISLGSQMSARDLLGHGFICIQWAMGLTGGKWISSEILPFR